MSELCQIAPEPPVNHRDLRRRADAHRCCDIIWTSVSSLKSNDDAILVGSLELLGFARQFDWSSDAPLREADRAVKGAAPRLMTRSDRVAHQLAVTLGGTRDPEVRELLNQIAAQHPGAREQALIALRWIGEPAPQVHERR